MSLCSKLSSRSCTCVLRSAGLAFIQSSSDNSAKPMLRYVMDKCTWHIWILPCFQVLSRLWHFHIGIELLDLSHNCVFIIVLVVIPGLLFRSNKRSAHTLTRLNAYLRFHTISHGRFELPKCYGVNGSLRPLGTSIGRCIHVNERIAILFEFP